MILVTGATGNIGRELVSQLSAAAVPVRALVRAEMGAGMPTEYVDASFSFYVDGTLDESHVLPTFEQVTGERPRSFEQWATRHADAFR